MGLLEVPKNFYYFQNFSARNLWTRRRSILISACFSIALSLILIVCDNDYSSDGLINGFIGTTQTSIWVIFCERRSTYPVTSVRLSYSSGFGIVVRVSSSVRYHIIVTEKAGIIVIRSNLCYVIVVFTGTCTNCFEVVVLIQSSSNSVYVDSIT